MRNRYALTDEDVIELGRYGTIIEKHYGRPMDIEWGKDGNDGKLYICRRALRRSSPGHDGRYQRAAFQAQRTVKGANARRAIGQKIGAGPVRIIKDPSEMDRVQPGDVLVADMTDPNWEPVMKRASAIVTIAAADLPRGHHRPGTGCPGGGRLWRCTEVLQDGAMVTVSCAEGDEGQIYEGLLETEVTQIERGALAPIKVKLMMNVGNPQLASISSRFPTTGLVWPASSSSSTTTSVFIPRRFWNTRTSTLI